MLSRNLLGFSTKCGFRSHSLQRLLGFRTFLSDRYRCEAEWNERLNTPLLLKLKSENLYAELVKKFQNEGKASAIDVDLFSNLVTSESHLDELQEITKKFRRCVNTIYTLPSTGHAVIRTYLQYKHVDMLMKMLGDRLNYGLFLNYYLSNLLMDTFLKENNFRDAAKVAIELMLQEEFDHPITTHLALYSCYAYLKNRQPEPWDPFPTLQPEEPVEEVKVRVDYIREPFFDDHFDLVKPEQLIGKTLVGFGKHLNRQDANDAVGHTSLVLGWVLFEKYDKVLQSLDTILSLGSKNVLLKEWVEVSQKAVNEATHLPDTFVDSFNDRIKRLQAGGFISEENMQSMLKQRIEKGVEKQENADIEAQKFQYKNWEQLREDEVQKQIRAFEYRKRMAVLEAKKKELQEKEERLNFFEKIDDWEVKYEEKEEERLKRAKAMESRSKKVSSKLQRQAEEDAYFPPEIVTNRNKSQ